MMTKWQQRCKRLMLNNSYELYDALLEQTLLPKDHLLEWVNVGSFEAFIKVILLTQSDEQRVSQAWQALEGLGVNALDEMCDISYEALFDAILPSGFAKKKTQLLKRMAEAIITEYGDFTCFKQSVSRDWLLEIKGVSETLADKIRLLVCEEDVMIVDRATMKILHEQGYIFDSYEEAQAWLEEGILSHFEKIQAKEDERVSSFTIFSRLHYMISEYSQRK